MKNVKELNHMNDWDKTFPKSDKVNHRKVTFVNRYGITLAADLYEPKNAEPELSAIAVCGPFGAVNANGYFDAGDSPDTRHETRKALAVQRMDDYKKGSYELGGGVPDTLPDDAPFFVKDYYAYYKTSRGYHSRSLNSNGGWNKIGCMSFLNQPILHYADEIRSAVLVIHGEKAHSCYFSRDAFEKLRGDNKELMIIPNAVHTDLYDQISVIPFDKMETFFRDYLK